MYYFTIILRAIKYKFNKEMEGKISVLIKEIRINFTYEIKIKNFSKQCIVFTDI